MGNLHPVRCRFISVKRREPMFGRQKQEQSGRELVYVNTSSVLMACKFKHKPPGDEHIKHESKYLIN